MDLGILNTVIAVIVLLVLSLLVQSVQMLLKKLLTLKSKQIEDSLKDLFDQAIASATPPAQQVANGQKVTESNDPATATTRAGADGVIEKIRNFAATTLAAADEVIGKIRNVARLIIVGRSDPASAEAEEFTGKVLGEFKKIGRVTKFGRPVLDSLSKEDLFKVMAKFESEKFSPIMLRSLRICGQVSYVAQSDPTPQMRCSFNLYAT